MTSKPDQSSNQDCREFLVVTGKPGQFSLLPPLYKQKPKLAYDIVCFVHHECSFAADEAH